MADNLFHVTVLNGHGEIKERRKFRINDPIIPNRVVVAVADRLNGPRLRLKIVRRAGQNIVATQLKRWPIYD